MHNSTQAGEQLLRQLTSAVSDLCFDIELPKLHMTVAGILSLYDIRLAKLPGCHPDIREKVDQFLSAKKLEGLSQLTLDGYALELRVFAEHVAKPVEEITTGDIRAYLGKFDHLKMSSIAKKLSVLKSFFGWLADEEIIPRDPARRIKPPKKEQRLPFINCNKKLRKRLTCNKTLLYTVIKQQQFVAGGDYHGKA